jgi:pantetheine-phosphate adenylyltransferase
VLRGIRAISDYEYELQMALMNRKLQPKIETVFMMPAEAYSYLSSRLVKEIARLHGDVSMLVPPLVARRLREALQNGHARLQALEPPTEAHEIDSSVGSVTPEFKGRRGVRRRK